MADIDPPKSEWLYPSNTKIKEIKLLVMAVVTGIVDRRGGYFA